MKKFLWYLIIHTATSSQDITLIVPGTWSGEMGWYAQSGDFYEAYREHNPSSCIVPFYWSGKNTHDSRVVAAHKLAALLDSYPHGCHVTLIAHSHGGNVALLASQLTGHQINTLYLLGTPISEEYVPDYTRIGHLINLFSWSDFIQPVFGYFERILPCNSQTCNCAVVYEGQEPNHTQLHDPLLAPWLTTLPHHLVFGTNGILEISRNQQPCYTHDEQAFKELLKIDRLLIASYTNALRNTSQLSCKETNYLTKSS